MLRELLDDLRAVHTNDPAATSQLETLLCHTPLHALFIYRIAHALHTRLRVPILPRLLSAVARFWTGAEIHPAARIGRRCFIDHGTGLVIGETAEIGDDCVLFHNVTLGGTGKLRGKRHPTVKDNVFLGVVIGLALAINTLIAVSIGGTVPLLLKNFGIDPAVASGPLLTTVTDMAGFFLVLSLATLFMPQLIA